MKEKHKDFPYEWKLNTMCKVGGNKFHVFGEASNI